MIEAIRNAFKLPDLRQKILFTFFILVIYRLGAHIPVPGVKMAAFKELFAREGGVLGFLDLFAGGALSNFAIFALGIMPYITASIIMTLLPQVIPTLQQWQEEGEVGQRKITQITRYLTLVLAIVESLGYTVLFQQSLRISFTPLERYLIVVTLTTGTALVMWLGELITQRGIGNGMSLLIFASIVARLPSGILKTFQTVNVFAALVFFAMLFLIIIGIVAMEKSQRRINVQYAKRIVGRRMYGGQSTYIPLKVNSAGVIPIIFATSVLLFPITLAKFFPGPFMNSVSAALSSGSIYRIIIEALLIIFFTYFYTAIIFNPIETADNIKKYGGFIPGVRPGKATAVYIDNILNRITLPGALFLAVIALLPDIFGARLGIPFFTNFGGTSLLILVGVALETMTQVEVQLMQRHYGGFLK